MACESVGRVMGVGSGYCGLILHFGLAREASSRVLFHKCPRSVGLALSEGL